MATQLFISYSHNDNEWLDRLKTTLKPLVRRGEISAFSDQDIQTGAHWREAIQQALDSAEVAVLLVTPDFLASDFIDQNELPLLLKAAETRKLAVFWIAVRYSTYRDSKIEPFQAANDPSRPLASLSPADLDKELVQIYDKIKLVMQANPEPAPPPSSPGVPLRNPYPGLRPFDEELAPYFYGRKEEIQRMLDAVDRFHFLMVLGPSGSGKSSLVFAGLLPQLRQKISSVPHPWTVLSLRPQQYPATNLDRRLPGVLEQPGEAVTRYLESKSGAQRLLLVVDQLEECFTQAEGGEREPFLGAIRNLREIERCTVVLTLRAVFFEDLMSSKLWPVGTSDRIEVVPLREDQMRDAIVEPARAVGVTIEEGLVELLLADAAGEPGRLSLLQSTLELLWGKMQNRVLPLEAYTQLGEEGRQRVAYALASKADSALDDLSPAQQQTARRIFLRLVQFVEGRPETRRQQSMSSLLDTAEYPTLVEQTVSRLADRGLLVVDRQGVGEAGSERVDLTHEALITAWPALRQWIDQGKEAEQSRRRWEAKAYEWVQYGRKSFLLDEEPLQELEAWLKSPAATSVRYSSQLVEFAVASRQALAQREGAQSRLRAADLAAYAEGWLERDPELALRLAIEAVSLTWRQSRPPSGEAEDALRQALIRAPVRQIRHDHQGEVLGMTVSKDGKLLATTGADGTAKVWRVTSGQLQATMTGHAGPVYGAAFDPEGPHLATAGADSTLRIWDLADGREIMSLDGQGKAVLCAAYSSSGHLLVAGGEDGVARIWDLAEKTTARELRGHRRPIRSVAFSPNGTYVATTGDDAIVRIWKAGTGEEAAALQGHVNRVWKVAWISYSRLVVTAGEDRTVRVWDVETGSSRPPLRQHTKPVRDARFDASTWILTTGEDGTVSVSDLETGRAAQTFHSPGARLIGAAYTQGERNRLILATDAEGTTRLWEATGGQEISVQSFSDAYRLGGAVYSPAGPRVLLLVSSSAYVYSSGPYRSYAEVRDPESGSVVTTLQGAAGTSPGYSTYTASGGYSSSAQARDAESGAVQATIQAHASGVNDAQYSPDGRLIATAGQDGTARIWDAATGRQVASLTGHKGPVRRISWSPDGQRVVTASEDRTAAIWAATAGRLIRTLAGHGDAVQAALFSPTDGRWVATASADGKVRIWESDTGNQIHELGPGEHTAGITGLAWSPDGSRIATASEDGTARIWLWTERRREHLLTGHEGGLLGIAWSPDGQTLATAGRDHTVRLWNASNGGRRGTLRGHTAEVVAVAFSPDGKRVASTGNDRTVRQYLVDVQALLDLAEARKPRELTTAERATYLAS
jgi:WD40 repeat protein